MGLIDDGKWQILREKWAAVDHEKVRLSNLRINPSEKVNDWLVRAGSSPLEESVRAIDLLCRPEVTYGAMRPFLPLIERPLTDEEAQSLAIEVKYAGYIERQQRQIIRLSKGEKVYIPEDFSYDEVPGLLSESRQKLEKIRPQNLAQASRISGVTPADIQLLSVYLETRRRRKERGITPSP
jgi:tRNA uridine 5-carboxymethylaminomethyl modification enzyme